MLGTTETNAFIQKLNIDELSVLFEVGKETLTDIIQALQQPGRDLRDEMPAPILRKEVLSMEDLRKGMQLQGTVRNVVDFGAFVDIGVKQDGLVHISKLSKQFVKNPSTIVSVGDVVTVWVEEIESNKNRIALTMLSPIVSE